MSEEPALRDEMRRRSPRWFTRRVAYRVLYSIALHFDALVQMMSRAIKLRYAGLYSNETLPLLARETDTILGLNETEAQLAERIHGAWQREAGKGGPYTLLDEIWLHYRPSVFRVDLVYPSGAHFVLNTNRTVTWDPIDFEVGFPSAQWARWFLIYSWPTAIADDGLWDDEAGNDTDNWDAPGVWDYAPADLSEATVADLRRVPAAYNNAHCFGQIILLDAGNQLWDFPDGDWDDGDDDWDSPGADEPVTLEIR